ncbi:hypothetical protein QCI77_21675 [Bacillus cereus group sp. MG9]|uniref:hypothetical protein n=1 Tax=Bacillus cereus group sp. MG9 TaxID=3040247 RepID=UPI0033969701
MIDVMFYDWCKNRSKKHKLQAHEIRIFELIFSRKLREFDLGLNGIEIVEVFCLAKVNKGDFCEFIVDMNQIDISISYDFMDFLTLNSVEEKYEEFCKLVRQYVIPALEENSNLLPNTIRGYIEDSLDEIVKQNYEGIFLVGKTPKKSPSRKKIAILKGIHRVKGFQLRCEVYDEKGLKIRDQLLVEEVGNEMVYARFLGTLKWESENLIVVQSKTSSWKEEICI